MTRPDEPDATMSAAPTGAGRQAATGEAGYAWLEPPWSSRASRPARGPGLWLALATLWSILGVAVMAPLLANDRPIAVHEAFPGALERHLDHLARAYPYDIRRGLSGVDEHVRRTLRSMTLLVDPSNAARLRQAVKRWDRLGAASAGRTARLAFLEQVHAEFRDVPAVAHTFYPVLSDSSGWEVVLLAGFSLLTLVAGLRMAVRFVPIRPGARAVVLVGGVVLIAGLTAWIRSLPSTPHRPAGSWLETHPDHADPEGWSLAPLVRFAPDRVDSRSRLRPPLSCSDPGGPHWLGTDDLGRDVASLLIWGTRTSLFVGLASVALLLAIGIALGATAGYFRGAWDLVVFRVIEVFESFPSLILILVGLAFLESSLWVVILVIGCTRWTTAARLVRSECLRLRKAPFVAAAQGLGLSAPRVMLRHMLPGALSSVAVHAVFAVAAAILVEASLAFLGLGDQGVVSWGQVIDRGRHVVDAWWVTVFPGVALFVTLLTLRALGEGIRTDPRCVA